MIPIKGKTALGLRKVKNRADGLLQRAYDEGAGRNAHRGDPPDASPNTAWFHNGGRSVITVYGFQMG